MEHLNPTPSWGLWWSSFIMLVLFIIMQYSCSSSAARSLGNETDRMALLDIKLQMNDPNGFLNLWNDSHHHCQWPGIRCDTRHQRITALFLPGKILSGTISAHIGNLSFMKVIQLGSNLLHGGIPQQLGQLSRLRSFTLSYNLLSGEIPISLSRCSQLRYIDLTENRLTGKIPVELGSLTKLQYIDIDTNNLTGEIPASLGNLSSSLTTLILGFNSLEGYVPNELGSLSRLRVLGLGPNKLRGKIPSSLFNMSTLTALSVSSNFFSGKLPVNLGQNLPNLQILEFGGNSFSGEIPVSITNCTNLEILDLSENKFEGKFAPTLGQLVNLNLEKNFLSGNVMDFLVPLTNCTKLVILALSGNNISGELSSPIGNLSSQLTKLYLAHTKISGTIPVELGNLVRLNILSLNGNSLTGAIPANLTTLRNLEILSIRENMLSGQIPATLCSSMTKLYNIELDDNNLTGDLNHSLASCRSLQHLRIDGNMLNGSIPSHMFGYNSIQLYLSSNSLSGILPLELGKLANLQQLDVSHNKLSGHIPLTIGGCSVITDIDMSSNQFNGSLPPSLASLKGIEYLDLSDNTLTGKIPRGLNHLIFLKYLNLSYNDLEGEVPTDGVFSNASQIMLQGNNKLCGGISELELPPCPIVVVHRMTKGKNHLKTILIPLFSALVISITLFLYLFLCKKRDRVREGMPPTPSEKMLRVSYHDLYRASNKFSPGNLIGSGNFGFVYRGNLVVDHEEIKVVAVKVLDLQKLGASKSFMAECKALTNLRHRNLVPLLTYCSSIDYKGDEFKALVYKYMENGSLDTWLHPADESLEPQRCLNLLQRLNIAMDVASALDHLHNHSHIAIAHCDVKPSNILLDDELTAYVGDFGLARLLPQLEQGASSSTLAIKGTIGYAAPEYAMGMEVSTQGDVYSYGVLLLEMFTGRRPTSDAFTDGLNLHDYVEMGLSDQVWKIVDPSLLSEEAQVETRLKEQECIISALKLGIRCSQELAKDRMDMKQVTRELHFIRDSLRRC